MSESINNDTLAVVNGRTGQNQRRSRRTRSHRHRTPRVATHINITDNSDSEEQCFICNTTYSSQDALLNHLATPEHQAACRLPGGTMPLRPYTLVLDSDSETEQPGSRELASNEEGVSGELKRKNGSSIAENINIKNDEAKNREEEKKGLVKALANMAKQYLSEWDRGTTFVVPRNTPSATFQLDFTSGGHLDLPVVNEYGLKLKKLRISKVISRSGNTSNNCFLAVLLSINPLYPFLVSDDSPTAHSTQGANRDMEKAITQALELFMKTKPCTECSGLFAEEGTKCPQCVIQIYMKNESEHCAICLENARRCYTLPCNHKFHIGCVAQLRCKDDSQTNKCKRLCPLCRAPFLLNN